MKNNSKKYQDIEERIDLTDNPAYQSSLEEQNKILRETVDALQNELNKFTKPPLIAVEVVEVYDNDTVMIRLQNGNEFLVNKLSEVETKPGDMVLADQKNLVVIDKINTTKKFNVSQFVIIDKPKLSYKEIGGLKEEINEIQEVVELPIKKPELFKKVGITPPKGVLLYGPPGTGKTLLAKAVANATDSTFIEIVGSELVQKFIGEGAKMVKEIFQLAREKAPSIIFIDEIDALAAKRIETGTSGEREVQRTFMQLLAEIDGFDALGNVKVIAATNRKDILDPAVIRPGRLDRLIEIGLPDEEGRMQIFKIHTKNMKLDSKVDFKKLVKETEDFSGAEIKAVVTEAGYFAIRANRNKILMKDFEKAIKKIKIIEPENEDYKDIFG